MTGIEWARKNHMTFDASGQYRKHHDKPWVKTQAMYQTACSKVDKCRRSYKTKDRYDMIFWQEVKEEALRIYKEEMAKINR